MDLTLKRRFKDDTQLVSWLLDRIKECKGGYSEFISWFKGYYMAGNGILVDDVAYSFDDCIIRLKASEGYSRI